MPINLVFNLISAETFRSGPEVIKVLGRSSTCGLYLVIYSVHSLDCSRYRSMLGKPTRKLLNYGRPLLRAT